jgi:hypothetical protein
MPRIGRLLRGGLAVVGAMFLLGGVVHGANWLGYRLLRHRLDTLYSVGRELRKGMPRDDVLNIIASRNEPYLHMNRHDEEAINLWVQYALVDACEMAIGFKDGRLVSTWIIGEDSPTDYCPGAPPDIR